MVTKKNKGNNDDQDNRDWQAEVEQLELELEKLRQEKDEHLIGWQRALADYQNLQKEMLTQKSQAMAWGEEKIIQDFLPVWENFRKAMVSQNQIVDDLQANISDDGLLKKVKNWQLGTDYIQKQITDLLNEWGATRVPTVGKLFDPACHEALQIEHDDKHLHNEILKELSAGYYLKDRLLFPAKVVVNNLGDEEIAEANS